MEKITTIRASFDCPFYTEHRLVLSRFLACAANSSYNVRIPHVSVTEVITSKLNKLPICSKTNNCLSPNRFSSSSMATA